MNDRILFDRCPLCESTALADSVMANCTGHPLYHPSLNPQMKWKRCTSCAHVFTEGYYTEEACKLIFSKTNEQQQVGYDIENQRVTSSHIVEKVLPHVRSGRWLDVGFGNGSLLFTAQEYGFVAVGLDLRQNNVQQISSLGIEAHCEDLGTVVLPSRCAVISMADVLEHVPFPHKMLLAAHRQLEDDGVLFLSMPNMDNIVWKAMDQQNANPYWGEIEHYHNFTRDRLYRLLRQNGFEPVQYGISERYRASMEVLARKA